MKRLLLSILILTLTLTVLAQNQKVRVGLFKSWYVGAFSEVIGNYSVMKDSVSKDSIRLWIKNDAIFYDNEVFENIYTVEAREKIHFYSIYAENENNRVIKLYMYPKGIHGWSIYLEDNAKEGWEGIWKRKEPELYKY